MVEKDLKFFWALGMRRRNKSFLFLLISVNVALVESQADLIKSNPEFAHSEAES